MGARPTTIVTRNRRTHASREYSLVNNGSSLLMHRPRLHRSHRAPDFSRIAGKDREGVLGVDQDAMPFAAFISQFLSK